MGLQNLINTSTTIVEDTIALEAMSDTVISDIISVSLESVCTDEELDELTNDNSSVTESMVFSPVLEKSIVKLDKSAKKQRAYKLAILHVAKEMGLKDYKQWCTIRKMDILLMRKMEKRCATKAKAYMREAQKRAAESTKNPLKKVANYLTRSKRNTQLAMQSGGDPIPSDLKSKTSSLTSKLGV